MAADLVLIQGLPGGAYRLEVAEGCDGGQRFTGSEMCACGAVDGPHWHDITSASTLADLFVALLEWGLRPAVTP